ELAIEHEVRVVLVLDEFQRLGEVDPGYALEAGIRHAAEQIKATTLVFLGSNRRLMEQAFTSKGRPLYRHCRSLNLARIEADAYRSHIQIAAMDRWGADLSPEAIEAIISLTERHPYYVNNLCNHLWAEDIAPSLDAVENMWNCVVQEVRYQHEGELLRLTPNQRRMLIALAEEPTSKPSSKEFVFRSGIASGSIENTIIPLLDNDFIARDKDNRLYVVDPAVAEIARSFA
ncbi:MAG: hypothetical protein GY784_01485, partial [Gammaproteobacteria bacterium]|nr:hypothetical protein [Gammaproteobacteria bacterium]